MHRVDQDYADFVAWRRDIRAHPELGFEVHGTAEASCFQAP